MSQLERRPSAGRVIRLTRDRAMVTGSLDYIRAVLAAAERAGQLAATGAVMPSHERPGDYLVNVRLQPSPPAASALPVARPAPAVQREPVVVTGTSRGRIVALSVVGVVAVMLVALLIVGGIELVEWVERNRAAVIGGAVITVAAVAWWKIRAGRDCIVTHTRR